MITTRKIKSKSKALLICTAIYLIFFSSITLYSQEQIFQQDSFNVDESSYQQQDSDLLKAEEELVNQLKSKGINKEQRNSDELAKAAYLGIKRISENETELNKATKNEINREAAANIAKPHRSNVDLKKQLQTAKKQLTQLKKKLEETNSHLILAETEVERLSRVLEIRNENYVQRMTISKKTHPASYSSSHRSLKSSRAKNRELLIATVTSGKAFLRSGPGNNNSPLMTVMKGTRLTVETRSGEWYRVITPTGNRAWVSSSVVGFGKRPFQSPERVFSGKGYRSYVNEDLHKTTDDKSTS